MARYAMAIDLNRCVNCKACNAACKMANGVPIGQFWNWVERKQSNVLENELGGPSHDFYYFPMQCQHCGNPECVNVCPTGASFKAENGTVQIDSEACIGCGLCLDACPYGVRYINPSTAVAEKCKLCYDRIEQGERPQCALGCVGMAKYFGDLDEGIESFRGPCGEILGDYVKPFTEDDVYQLENHGNDPSFVYILRNHTWMG